jgi:hypothetical protein
MAMSMDCHKKKRSHQSSRTYQTMCTSDVSKDQRTNTLDHRGGVDFGDLIL